MRHLALLLLSAVLMSACGGNASQTASNSENVNRYDMRGKVVSVDRV